MIRTWGKSDLLLTYESVTFIQQLASFSLVWASIAEFQTYSQPSHVSDKQHDSIVAELAAILCWLGISIAICIVLLGLFKGWSYVAIGGYAMYTMTYLPTILIEYSWIKRGRYWCAIGIVSISQLSFICAILIPLGLDWNPEVSFLFFPLIALTRFALLLRESRFEHSLTKWNLLKQRFNRLIPVAASYLLSGSQLYSAGLVVGWLLRPSDFLTYRFGIREIPLVHLLNGPVWMQSASYIGRYKDVAPKRLIKWVSLFLKKESFRIGLLTCFIHLLLLIAAPKMFEWLYAAKMQDACLPFQLMLLLPAVLVVNPRGVLIGFDKRKVLFYISVYEFIFYVAMCFMFVYLFGVTGISLAFLLSASLERWLLVRQAQRLGLQGLHWIPWKVISIFIGLSMLTLLFQHSKLL